LAPVNAALDALPDAPDTPAEADAALERLRASLRALGEMRRELDGLGRAFREVAGASRALLGPQQGQNPTAHPALAAVLDQLQRSVERFNRRVRAFVGHADEELARSSRLLTGAVSDLEGEPR
jgi:hypothetical protein